MYKSFFELKENPFNVSPDPRYIVLTKQIEEAFSGLMYGIQTKKGILTLTGEVGTGKTTLVNRLLDWLNTERAKTAFLFNSRLNSNQLLDFVLSEFEISCESTSKSRQLMKLNEWLLEQFRAGQTAVLIIDEAQNLTFPVLEEIRLLTNLETASEKLIQIVLTAEVAAIEATTAADGGSMQDRSADERRNTRVRPRTIENRRCGTNCGTDLHPPGYRRNAPVLAGCTACN
jgi:general secretion pathway protein A